MVKQTRLEFIQAKVDRKRRQKIAEFAQIAGAEMETHH